MKKLLCDSIYFDINSYTVDNENKESIRFYVSVDGIAIRFNVKKVIYDFCFARKLIQYDDSYRLIDCCIYRSDESFNHNGKSINYVRWYLDIGYSEKIKIEFDKETMNFIESSLRFED